MKKKWKLSESSDSIIIDNLEKDLKVSNIIAKILANRNIKNYKEAKKFFRPQIEDLINPFLMKGFC